MTKIQTSIRLSEQSKSDLDKLQDALSKNPNVIGAVTQTSAIEYAIKTALREATKAA